MKYSSNITKNPHNGAWSAWWWSEKTTIVSLGEYPSRTDAERAVQDAHQRDEYNRATQGDENG